MKTLLRRRPKYLWANRIGVAAALVVFLLWVLLFVWTPPVALRASDYLRGTGPIMFAWLAAAEIAIALPLWLIARLIVWMRN